MGGFRAADAHVGYSLLVSISALLKLVWGHCVACQNTIRYQDVIEECQICFSGSDSTRFLIGSWIYSSFGQQLTMMCIPDILKLILMKSLLLICSRFAEHFRTHKLGKLLLTCEIENFPWLDVREGGCKYSGECMPVFGILSTCSGRDIARSSHSCASFKVAQRIFFAPFYFVAET